MAEPLRILVVGVAWPMETFLERLVKGLLAQGMLVTIANARRPEAAWFSLPGFSWLQVSSSGLAVWRRLGFVLSRLLWALLLKRRDYQKIKPEIPSIRNFSLWLYTMERILPYLSRRWDVIYFPWNSAAIEHRALFKLGIPVVISCRGSQIQIAPYNPRRTEYRQGLSESLHRAARIHCVSRSIQDDVLQYGVEPARVKVIYPAVDPENFYNQNNLKDRAESSSPFRVISVGSLIWRKGYEFALQAVALLRAQGVPVQYEIIGAGKERSRVVFAIHDLGIEDCVTLSGQLPPEAVRQHLQQSDAFLLASLSEGVSNAVLEAMACGLPVVTADCGGMREAVADGLEGFVVPPRDHAAMAQALLLLWRSPALRQQMGQAGRQKVLDQHALKDQIASFIELFHEAVGHG